MDHLEWSLLVPPKDGMLSRFKKKKMVPPVHPVLVICYGIINDPET